MHLRRSRSRRAFVTALVASTATVTSMSALTGLPASDASVQRTAPAAAATGSTKGHSEGSSSRDTLPNFDARTASSKALRPGQGPGAGRPGQGHRQARRQARPVRAGLGRRCHRDAEQRLEHRRLPDRPQPRRRHPGRPGLRPCQLRTVRARRGRHRDLLPCQGRHRCARHPARLLDPELPRRPGLRQRPAGARRQGRVADLGPGRAGARPGRPRREGPRRDPLGRFSPRRSSEEDLRSVGRRGRPRRPAAPPRGPTATPRRRSTSSPPADSARRGRRTPGRTPRRRYQQVLDGTHRQRALPPQHGQPGPRRRSRLQQLPGRGQGWPSRPRST